MPKCKIISLLAALAFMFSTAGYAEDNITGEYKCHGYDPIEDVRYQGGTLSIEANDDYYKLDWSFQDGSSYKGKGLLNDSETVISSLLWQVDKADRGGQEVKGYGLQVYEIIKEGAKLKGKWLISDNDNVGYEVCERIDDDD